MCIYLHIFVSKSTTMADQPLTEKDVNALVQALQRGYITRQELTDTIDGLLFALFFLDTDTVSEEDRQRFATFLRLLQKELKS